MNLSSESEKEIYIKGLGYVVLESNAQKGFLSKDIVTKVFYCKQKVICTEKTTESDIIYAFRNFDLVDAMEIIRGDRIIKIYPSDKTRKATSVPNSYNPIYLEANDANIIKDYLSNNYVCKNEKSLRMGFRLTDYGIIFKLEKGLNTEEIPIFNLMSCDKYVCKLVNKGRISGLLSFYSDDSIYVKLNKDAQRQFELDKLGEKFFSCGIWLKN